MAVREQQQTKEHQRYSIEISKLLPGLEDCLNIPGGYVEK